MSALWFFAGLVGGACLGVVIAGLLLATKRHADNENEGAELMNGEIHPTIAQRRRLAAYHAARLNAMHVAERERALREWRRPSKADETNKARWEFVLGIVLWAAIMGVTSWIAGWLP